MTAASASHLQSKSIPLLELSDEERIRVIRSGMFINMPRFDPIFKRLHEMLEAPEVVRPQSLLLVAPPNNGKSSIFEQFLHEMNGSDDRDEEVAKMRVLMINTPPSGDRTSFYQRILDALFGEFNERSKFSALRSQAHRQLRAHGIRLLLLDELHDAMLGTPNQQDLFITELKQFTNQTKIPIAAAGLDKAPALFVRDSQLTSRFNVVELPPFQPDKELALLLATLGRRLPLRRASDLKDPKVVAEVSRRAEGAIGDIYSLIAHCAIEAIKDKSEEITWKGICKADWQRPTQRAAFTRGGRRKLAAEIKRNDEAAARELSGGVDDEDDVEQAPVEGLVEAASPAPKVSRAKSAQAPKPASAAKSTPASDSSDGGKPAPSENRPGKMPALARVAASASGKANAKRPARPPAS